MKNIKFKIIFVFVLIFLCSFGAPANAIKIGLHTNKKSFRIGVSNDGLIVNARTGHSIMLLNQMFPYKLYKKGGAIIIAVNNQKYKINADAIIIKNKNNQGHVYTKNKWYKGDFLVLNNKSGLTLINNVDMESYIKGVVPSEMPSSWGIEAHRAQAIAARSYAVANIGKRSKYGYDLRDTPHDQAYGGATAETARTNQAVMSTRGMVLMHNNKVIPAYYHASAGGHTLSAKRVWGNELPYIKPVNAYDGHMKKNGHGVGMSQNGANVLAKYGYDAYQILGHFYRNVRLQKVYN